MNQKKNVSSAYTSYKANPTSVSEQYQFHIWYAETSEEKFAIATQRRLSLTQELQKHRAALIIVFSATFPLSLLSFLWPLKPGIKIKSISSTWRNTL